MRGMRLCIFYRLSNEYGKEDSGDINKFAFGPGIENVDRIFYDIYVCESLKKYNKQTVRMFLIHSQFLKMKNLIN